MASAGGSVPVPVLSPLGETSRGVRSGPVLDSTSRSVTCRLRVELPLTGWLPTLTLRHPGLRVEVESALAVSEHRMLSEARIYPPGPDGSKAELGELTGASRVELLEESERSTLCRVVHTTPSWVAVSQRLSVPWRYPYWVEAGTARWTVVAPEEQLRSFIAALSLEVRSVRIEALTRGVVRGGSSMLTDRQSELVRRAVQEGYFDVPRRITLTELSRRLCVSTSTLCERLAVAERKVILGSTGEVVGPPFEPAD